MNTDNLIYGIMIVCSTINWSRWIVFARQSRRNLFKYLIIGFFATLLLAIAGIGLSTLLFETVLSSLPQTIDFYRYLADLIATLFFCSCVFVPTHIILRALAKRHRHLDSGVIDMIGRDPDAG